MIGRDIGCCWAADDRQHSSLQSQRMRFLDIQLEKRKIMFTHLSKDEHGLYLLFRPRVLMLWNILGLVVLVAVPHKRAGGDGMRARDGAAMLVLPLATTSRSV